MEITRFDIDYERQKLYLTADAGEGNTIAAIKIDNCRTFNCREEASTNAYVIRINSQSVEDMEIDLSYVEQIGYPANKIIPLDKGLFFAFFYEGDEETGFDTMRVFYDEKSLARQIFQNIKSDLLPCGNSCGKVRDDIVDKVMLFFGVREALAQKEYRYACDFIQAIYKNGRSVTSNCGCNGR